MSQHALLKQAADYLQQEFEKHGIDPKMAIVLGSGLDTFADSVTSYLEMDYAQIPGFPETSVAGHPGVLVVGKLEEHAILVFKGRVHVYEGYSAEQAAFISYLLCQLNITKLISTNAVGGMRPELYLGALVLIEDHLNFSFNNPLIGAFNDSTNPLNRQSSYASRDLKNTYDLNWQKTALEVAKNEGIRLHRGIYGGISGPSYLSVAELKMLRRLGADVVGMSTIPEVIVGKIANFQVLGISCVTDMVVPEALEPLDHDMVVRVANQTKPKFTQLLRAIIHQLLASEDSL